MGLRWHQRIVVHWKQLSALCPRVRDLQLAQINTIRLFLGGDPHIDKGVRIRQVSWNGVLAAINSCVLHFYNIMRQFGRMLHALLAAENKRYTF